LNESVNGRALPSLEGENGRMKTLGLSIREERRMQNLTLDQLSQKTGLSKSFLSQIERNLGQPSITSLKKIAHVLGMSVVNLFIDETNQNIDFGRLPLSQEDREKERIYVKDVKIVRSAYRKSLVLPGSKIVYALLTPAHNRQVEVMYVRIGPHENSGTEPTKDPPGEKFALVLKGSLQFTIEDNVYQMHEGDSIYFPADSPFSWQGIGKSSIEVLWVLTPPWF